MMKGMMEGQGKSSMKKPTDLDLHCLQNQGISRFRRTRVNTLQAVKKSQQMTF